jgi:hypothetical protein
MKNHDFCGTKQRNFTFLFLAEQGGTHELYNDSTVYT